MENSDTHEIGGRYAYGEGSRIYLNGSDGFISLPSVVGVDSLEQ